MADRFLKNAQTFFDSFQGVSSKNDSEFLKNRDKMVTRMDKERSEGNFFSALLIYSALICFGLGIATREDIKNLNKLCSKEPKKLKHIPRGVEVLLIRLQEAWALNDPKKGSSISQKLQDNNTNIQEFAQSIWKISRKNSLVEKYYEKAGGANGTSFLHQSWPEADCSPETARALCKAVVPDGIAISAIKDSDDRARQFVNDHLSSKSGTMKQVNEKLKTSLSNPKYPYSLIYEADEKIGEDPNDAAENAQNESPLQAKDESKAVKRHKAPAKEARQSTIEGETRRDSKDNNNENGLTRTPHLPPSTAFSSIAVETGKGKKERDRIYAWRTVNEKLEVIKWPWKMTRAVEFSKPHHKLVHRPLEGKSSSPPSDKSNLALFATGRSGNCPSVYLHEGKPYLDSLKSVKKHFGVEALFQAKDVDPMSISYSWIKATKIDE